jgi:hypothetical protein
MSLSARFERLLSQLDEVVAKAIAAVREPTNYEGFLSSRNVEGLARDLEEIVLQLRVWANDMTFPNPPVESNLSDARFLSVLDSLKILDYRQGPITEDLHKIFEDMQFKVVAIADVSRLVPEVGRAEGYASPRSLGTKEH